MEKYLIAMDMDGTLLNSQGKVSKKTVEVLNRLMQKGHYIVPASGRAFTLLPKEVLQLEGIQYAVLENGAVVWDWKNQWAIKQESLPKGLAKAILADIEKQTFAGYCAEIIVNGKVYADMETQKELDCPGSPENFVRYMRQNHIFIENLSSRTDLLDTAEKLNIYFDDVKLSEIVRAKWRTESQLNVTTSVSGNAEFTAAGINKGYGIKILQQHLGIPKEHCIAIGDDENDLEMFGQVHMAVAMGNAKENVKRAADEITLDCDNDGAAVYLEKYC